MRIFVWPDGITIVVDVIAWGCIHAGTGYAVHRMRVETLARDRFWSRRRAFETRRFYERALRVKRWKDRLPEAGGLFPGGVSKRSLPSRDAGGIERFVIETRRAELGHWLAALASPLFVLWNPPVAAALMLLYGFGVNLPFIVVQRYNRMRAARILDR